MTQKLTIGDVSAVVLAGGRGQRMGGQDKGLIELAGRPLVARVVERLKPQVASIHLNINRHSQKYNDLGYPILPDLLQDYQGPLAGMQAALATITQKYVLTVPCDSPLIPMDLAERLQRGLQMEDAKLAVATLAGRDQPVFLLMQTDLRQNLETYLKNGGRKIDAWYNALKVARVSFDYEADCFFNVNMPEDLKILSQKMASLSTT